MCAAVRHRARTIARCSRLLTSTHGCRTSLARMIFVMALTPLFWTRVSNKDVDACTNAQWRCHWHARYEPLQLMDTACKHLVVRGVALGLCCAARVSTGGHERHRNFAVDSAHDPAFRVMPCADPSPDVARAPVCHSPPACLHSAPCTRTEALRDSVTSCWAVTAACRASQMTSLRARAHPGPQRA